MDNTWNRTTVGEIFDEIDRIAPFDTQCDFDNAGLLAGSRDKPVYYALVALDATSLVIDEAAARDCQLIITHHPIIFHPLRSIEEGSPVCGLVRSGMSIICAHTNLDKAERGVNYCLAKYLSLEDIHPLEGLEFGFGGTLPEEMSCREFADYIAGLTMSGCRYNPVDRKLRRIAVIGGAGGDEDPRALLRLGYDALVTGEAKHHEFLNAAEHGLCLIAAGHHETEAVVLDPLVEHLSKCFTDVMFTAYDINPTRCAADMG